MAVTAKNASKCKNHWYQPSLQTSIDTLVPVADLISPNLRSSGFPGKPGQEFSPKIAYFWRSKMFLQVCTVGLGYKNSASHVCVIENFKFDHVFCNNFCNNWAKIRQCGGAIWGALVRISSRFLCVETENVGTNYFVKFWTVKACFLPILE